MTACEYCDELKERCDLCKIGVEAITYLQAMAGTVETEEQALEGWRNMSDAEMRSTLAAYRVFVPLKRGANYAPKGSL